MIPLGLRDSDPASSVRPHRRARPALTCRSALAPGSLTLSRPGSLLDVDEVLPDPAAPLGPLHHRAMLGALDGDEVVNAVVAAPACLLARLGEQNFEVVTLSEINKSRLFPVRKVLPALELAVKLPEVHPPLPVFDDEGEGWSLLRFQLMPALDDRQPIWNRVAGDDEVALEPGEEVAGLQLVLGVEVGRSKLDSPTPACSSVVLMSLRTFRCSFPVISAISRLDMVGSELLTAAGGGRRSLS